MRKIILKKFLGYFFIYLTAKVVKAETYILYRFDILHVKFQMLAN